MSCGRPHETDCAEILERMFLFIDHEMDDADCTKIQQHLDECSPCLAKYDLEELVNGPPVSASFAPDGSPTPAAAGFAAKQGVQVSALERVETPKGVYLAFRRKQRGKAAVDVLPAVLGGVLRGLTFPKLMHWDAMLEDGPNLFGPASPNRLSIVGRLKPDVTKQAAEAAPLAKSYSDIYDVNRTKYFVVRSGSPSLSLNATSRETCLSCS